MGSFHSKVGRTTAGRWVTTFVTVWYALIVIGVPLPAPRHVFSERFPCENCHCGCSSAEHCWKHCCCHTLEERLAWAKRAGDEPPSFIRQQLLSANTDPACCTRHTDASTPATTRSGQQPTTRTCCASTATCRTANAPYQSLDGWRALACQATGNQWTLATPTIPAAPMSAADTQQRIEWIIAPHRPLALNPYLSPPVPPPRLHADRQS